MIIWGNVMIDCPRLFALVCLSTGSVDFARTSYTEVQNFRNSIPSAFRDNFRVVRYDPCPHYLGDSYGMVQDETEE